MNDLKTVLRMPSTWDLTYLKQFETADGVTWDRVMQRIGAALLGFNQSLRIDPWSGLIRVTTDLTVEYGVGEAAAELPLMKEHGRADLLAGDSTGHMIPMRDYGGNLGWTALALRRMSANKIDDALRTLIERSKNTWGKRIMERLFKSAAETVGAAGKSAPFADGGTTDSRYIPLAYDGLAFDSSHTHLFRKTDDATGRSAAILDMMNTLREHGINGPYVLVIPDTASEVALWTAQAEFVKPDRAVLLTAGVEKRSVVDLAEYLGVVETDRGWAFVKTSTRLPVNYVGMFKAFGFNNPASPLVVRYEKGYPLGLSIEGQIVQFPLQEAAAMLTFGVSVNNRVAGAATYFNSSGGYVDPTIT
jgi:hypothetical protein